MKFLVIGGCGFLGSHIMNKLLEKGYEVNVFDVKQSSSTERARFFVGDLCSRKDLLPALEGVDVVFHCASPPPLSDNQGVFYKVNVEGTKNVISACIFSGVKKLVLTSSASVVYEGKNIVNGKEDLPYAAHVLDYYTETKILQEKLVLKANSKTFHTVAIRPHGIFGPGDNHMVPTLAKIAKSGKSKYIIGNGKNIVDFTYVDNVVHGHILAAEQLHCPDSKVCGKAYFITNDEPLPFWTFMSKILSGLNYPEPRILIPYWLMYIVALVLQFLCFVARPVKRISPAVTPFSVAISATDHFYSCEKAKEDMGYKPQISLENGIQETLKHFSYLKKDTG